MDTIATARDNIGWVLLSVGVLLLTLSSIFKTRAERPPPPKRKGSNRTPPTPWQQWCIYGLMIIAGIALNIYGSLLNQRKSAERSQKQNAENQNRSTAQLLKLRERLEAVAATQHASKTEEAARITEEKINTIRMDLETWASYMATNLPFKKRQLEEQRAERGKRTAKAAAEQQQREIQLTAQAYPPGSFALRFLQESLAAYSKKARKDITIPPLAIPNNIFASPANAAIQFATNGAWLVELNTRPGPPILNRPPFTPIPAGPQPLITVHFRPKDPTISLGLFYLRLIPERGLIQLAYQQMSPTQDPVPGLNAEYPITEYEAPIQTTLQRVMEIELAKIDPK